MNYIIVAGARPNFVKIAPIMHAFREQKRHVPELRFRLVHTGQHYDARMSDDFFRDLEIPEPDINLGVGSGSHAVQTAKVMMAFEQVLIEDRPDWVIVVGDVNSTLACALTAKKLGIAVAHVEAGLRSRDFEMPEEINRICTDAIADVLFTTEASGGQNLLAESVAPERIIFAGNTMIDSLFRHIEAARSVPLPEGLTPGDFAVVTLHRPSNVDQADSLKPLLDTIERISRRIPIVFPAHPRTVQRMSEFGLLEWFENQPGIRMVPPISYLPFLGLISRARMVLTDSGGIQEETTALGIPCLTMRTNTERPVTCDIGSNLLVGTDVRYIEECANAVLDGRIRPSQLPEKWDGHAAERIVEELLSRTANSRDFRTALSGAR